MRRDRRSQTATPSGSESSAETALETIDYPSGDGKPMAESDLHRLEMTRLIEILTAFFARLLDVYVTGNNFIYYEQGNRYAFVSPDVYVVKGVPKRRRNSYFLWREGVAPQVVVEVTSGSTRRTDQNEKRSLYARMGVGEYFLYDPERDWVHNGLAGYRLSAGSYEPIREAPEGGLVSEELGLRLVLEDGSLQFYDQANGERLLSPEERADAAEERAEAQARERREADARAEAETQARRLAEARIAELEALLQQPPSPSP
ncbi:MAG: Uma2 family endonuclease [Dehalococcoidia bacterium]